MARLPTPGSDEGNWGVLLNDFLTVETNTDGTLKIRSDGTLAGIMHVVGNETIDGVKTFTSSPIVPTPTSSSQVANKTYVDSVAIAGAPNATNSTPGIVQLSGDLAGSATSPVVATGVITGAKIANTTITDTNISSSAAIAQSKIANLTTTLAAKVSTTRSITAGTGLTGGGDLSADRTLAVSNDTTTQRVRLSNNGTLTGTRQELNLIAGANVTITPVDDNANNRVNITIAASSGAQSTTITSTTQAGASYTFVLADAGTCVEGTSATAQAFTIPPQVSVPFATGTIMEVFQFGSGQITITPGSGVSLLSDGGKVATAGQYATISLRQRATNVWVLAGDLA